MRNILLVKLLYSRKSYEELKLNMVWKVIVLNSKGEDALCNLDTRVVR